MKTILLIDDEPEFLGALADALESEGYRVLNATTGTKALDMLEKEAIDLVTVDVMMPPGSTLEGKTSSHKTGLYLCGQIRQKYPEIDVFCISVVSDAATIREIERLGVRFLRKGETPLRTVLDHLRSRLTGIAYSSDRRRRRLGE